jgi:hypothetical protein
MSQTQLDKKIIAALLRYLYDKGDRHFSQLYRLINKHPKLNRNQRKHYSQAFFEEATQEAWLVFYYKNLQTLLKKLEAQGTAIAPENANIIVTRIIKELNILIRNKNVDIWRKETLPKAA